MKERIFSGEYKEGFSPRQEALAKDLGTSRISVREALFLLEGDGLVEFKPHKGAVVKSLTIEDLKELFHLRALLEWDVDGAINILKKHILSLSDVMAASLCKIIG